MAPVKPERSTSSTDTSVFSLTAGDRLATLFHVLRQRGVTPNIHVLPGEGAMNRRSSLDAVTWLTLFFQKFGPVTEVEDRLIPAHVETHSTDGFYDQRGASNVAMWWQV